MVESKTEEETNEKRNKGPKCHHELILLVPFYTDMVEQTVSSDYTGERIYKVKSMSNQSGR